jgi:pilus assembly protein CpaF
MLPPRQPAAGPLSAARAYAAQPMTFDAVKDRLLAKLEDRFDMSSSKRMPQSLLKQSLKQTADQLADIEARGFAKADRDRLVEAVLIEFLGYGPLEELFGDAAVREIMVAGPAAVIARRDSAQWMPTSVRFRDEGHVRATLDKMATHADAVGPVMASMAAFDVKLPNGFRAIALTPPDALGLPATAVFVREKTIPQPASKDSSGARPGLPPQPKSHPPAGVPAAAAPKPGSGLLRTPAPRGPESQQFSPVTRHRNRVLERILTKFASAGVHDVSRFDATELQRIVSAYVTEYTKVEKVYLNEADSDRLVLEVLAALRQ